ncbi:hypothetical protein JCM8547_001587 [Rhodosporidiobolus lusitaniae]
MEVWPHEQTKVIWTGEANEFLAASTRSSGYVSYSSASTCIVVLDFENTKKPVELLVQKPSTLATQLAVLASTPFPFDVLLEFPRSGRQIWSSETILSKSPYLKTLLSSAFSEGTSTGSLTTTTPPSDRLPFDDSDGEQDEKHDKSNSSTSSLSLPKHKSITVTKTAYSTYLAVVCWLQTGDIVFSPLSSSRSSSNAVLPATPSTSSVSRLTPVSPKSVYRLAHLLELPVLSSLALENFGSQLPIDNVVQELFSETAACYDEILSTSLDFAVKNLGVVKKTAGLTEARERAANGEMKEWEGQVWASLAGRMLHEQK